MKNKAGSFFKGFKEFITKGNILDLAIAFIIGTAFKAIITSLVNDIIMPLINTLTGESNFNDLIWIVSGSEIRYGSFIQQIVEFIIIAFSIYAAITLVIRRKEFNERIAKENAPLVEEEIKVVVPEDIKLLTEIRDQLKELQKK
ncbi:large conductance mechanosensitive channel protein MscL [Mariniplasma anaerobium]|uniref:Large-conductance mechanosensitive channel n=1 Tax=Mariniplasma anaerobium TaxID=2735436 RepID=A0A7U9TM17_9MOLU|nr:large conductance mechanosensitive channel protein MscL [Mariniplasma anaerobium]BCR35471.1 large-conductance mechanosensitive channel [Mariniplasma anaerobium]